MDIDQVGRQITTQITQINNYFANHSSVRLVNELAASLSRASSLTSKILKIGACISVCH
jgi:hypothetical protein